jgi:hypothetical protein
MSLGYKQSLEIPTVSPPLVGPSAELVTGACNQVFNKIHIISIDEGTPTAHTC